MIRPLERYQCVRYASVGIIVSVRTCVVNWAVYVIQPSDWHDCARCLNVWESVGVMFTRAPTHTHTYDSDSLGCRPMMWNVCLGTILAIDLSRRPDSGQPWLAQTCYRQLNRANSVALITIWIKNAHDNWFGSCSAMSTFVRMHTHAFACPHTCISILGPV